MGKKFTRQALNALTLAKKAAQSLNHSYIGTEHILAGLLKEAGGDGGPHSGRVRGGRGTAYRADLQSGSAAR